MEFQWNDFNKDRKSNQSKWEMKNITNECAAEINEIIRYGSGVQWLSQQHLKSAVNPFWYMLLYFAPSLIVASLYKHAVVLTKNNNVFLLHIHSHIRPYRTSSCCSYQAAYKRPTEFVVCLCLHGVRYMCVCVWCVYRCEMRRPTIFSRIVISSCFCRQHSTISLTRIDTHTQTHSILYH